ncbi:MAG: hypothetical protein HEQ23_10160 [Tepidisphaera sp.]
MKTVLAVVWFMSASALAQPWVETTSSSTYGSYVRDSFSFDSATGEWSAEYRITVKHLADAGLQQPFALTLNVNQLNVKFKQVTVTAFRDLSGNGGVDNGSSLSYCRVAIVPLVPAEDSISLFRKAIMDEANSTSPLVFGIGSVGQFGDSTTPGEIIASGIQNFIVATNIGSGNAWGTLRANGTGQFGRPASIGGVRAEGTTGWRGSVVSDNGSIQSFRAPAGTIIGSSGLPSVISAKNFIGWIEARNLDAVIETTTTAGTGTLGLLNVTNGGSFNGSYTTDFVGGTGVAGIPDGEFARVSVSGNLNADVTISKSVRNSSNSVDEINIGGSLVSGRTIKIGEQLQSNGIIRIGNASGLAGQIILNASNTVSSGVWSGVLSVNGATLPEEYTTLSSTFGGGASGAVPFAVHAADSGVVYGNHTTSNLLLQSAYDAASTSTNLVELEFYGPVRLHPSNATELPVTVVRGAGIEGCEENIFDASPSFTAVVSGRKLFLRRASGAVTPPHGTYAIVPKTTGPSILVCDGVSGNVPVSAEQFATFAIGRDCNSNDIPDEDELATEDGNDDGLIDDCVTPIDNIDYFCLADFNYDSFIDFFDYDAYLVCFQCGDCPPLRDADANFDTFVDFFDYEAFVFAFENGCNP